MELSYLLLARLEQRISRELEEDFARDVLAQLPEEGFVLESDTIRRWTRQASDSRGEPRKRCSLPGRLRGIFGAKPQPGPRAQARPTEGQ